MTGELNRRQIFYGLFDLCEILGRRLDVAHQHPGVAVADVDGRQFWIFERRQNLMGCKYARFHSVFGHETRGVLFGVVGENVDEIDGQARRSSLEP